MKNMTHEEMDAEFQRRVDIINYMVEKNIIDFREIARIVVSYYQYPEEIVKKIRDEMGWIREQPLPSGEEEAGGETVG
jgi:hypothetical protein